MAATATKPRPKSHAGLSVVGKPRPDQVEIAAVMAPMLAETKQLEAQRAAEQHPAQCQAVTQPGHLRAMCHGDHTTQTATVIATGGGFSLEDDGAVFPYVALFGMWTSGGQQCVSIELVTKDHSAEMTPIECRRLAAELLHHADLVENGDMRTVEQWNTTPQ